MTFTPNTTAALRVDVCYRSTNGTTVPTTVTSPSSGYKVVQAPVAGQPAFAAASNTFAPSAGTFRLGACMRLHNTGSPATTLQVSNNNWVSGWIMVTNN